MSDRDKTVQRFVNQLNELLSHHGELKLAIHNKKNESTLENELVCQFVLQAAVLWESFQSDLLLTYIVMKPSKALKSLETRIRQSVGEKFGKGCRRATNFTRPSRPSRAVLEGLLDHRGWNLTVRNADKLSGRANDLLASRYAKRFSLERKDSEFYNYVVALRNYLSHYSSGARIELKKTIDALSDDSNHSLKAPISVIGRYLKSNTGNGTTRAELVVERIKDIARKL